MKIALQALVTLAAAAAPQTEGRSIGPESAVVPALQAWGVPVQATQAQRQIADFDEKSKRLDGVGERLEEIIAIVVQMDPDEMEILDPVLLELFSKKEELSQVVEAGRDGLAKGLIDADDDIGALQDIMEIELAALEEAVDYLASALAEYTGQEAVIEI